jgi:O-antigen/teichoic acid export membrane protein
MTLQLGYAAVTSRLLAPSAFGAYAVALSGIGLMGVLSGSSLGQAAARREHDSPDIDRSLAALALALGSVSMIAAMLLASPWGRLWGAPESAGTTSILALSLPFTAVASVYAGVLRRLGRTTAVAARTAVAQVLGMVVGLAVVGLTREPWSLGVAVTTASVVSAVIVAHAVPRDRVLPGRPTRHVLEDLTYGGQSSLQSLLRTLSLQLTGWSISRFVGSAALGNYNRAQTLITIPVQRVQTALTFTLFPELRPAGPMLRQRGTFTDLMILVSWPAVVLGGIGLFVAAPFVRIVLGPGWEQAAAMAPYAVLLGVIPIVGVPLGSAVEALGKFKVMTVAWLGQTLCIAAGVLVTASTASAYPAIVGLVCATVVGLPV